MQRCRRCGVVTLSTLLLGFPSLAHSETRALLIGVSSYESPAVPDLVGPANDVPAMAALMRTMGASDITVLEDAAANRTSIESQIQSIGLRSRSGDWIVLYYSGHGAEAGAREAGAADPDQFILLPGFDPDKQDPERFVVDKDFYSWLRRYVPGDVRILMVVDSCHSGTMHRAIDPRLMSFTSRLGLRSTDDRSFKLVERPGPRLPALNASSEVAAGDARDLPNLVYIGASQDDELALETELPQEGSPQRGVLTFALEQGLSSPGAEPQSLAADLDLDGAVSVVELAAYLSGQVRMLSAQRQHSSAEFADTMSSALLLSSRPRPIASKPEALFAVAILDPQGAGPTTGASVPWRPAASPREADFQWLPKSGHVIRRSGDVVATGVTGADAMAGVIRKWSAVSALRPLVSEAGMQLTLDPLGEDMTYREGTAVTVGLSTSRPRLRRNRPQFATVFNLAADGTVQLLFPLMSDGTGMIGEGQDVAVLENRVVAPFGVDHIVALATPDRPQNLQDLLHALDGRSVVPGLVDQIKDTLRGARGAGSVNMLEIYTETGG